jgi:hypothetical protein
MIPCTLFDVEMVILSASFGTIAIIALDGMLALIIRRLLPKRWFGANQKIFSVSQKEHLCYRKLRIKQWKDLIPELGCFTNFHKDRLESANDSAYLERFLLESNFGVVIHLANAFFGFLIMFLPFCHSFSIWFPIFFVNLLLSLLPVAVLRYNTYTLTRLYQRSLHKQE